MADDKKPETYEESSPLEKEELIRTFLPLVKRVVHRLATRLPPEVDIKEMINSGIIGLVDALKKYSTSHETNFTTYAQFRIRGAIIDSFRSQDVAPRSIRHKVNRLESAFMRLEQQLGRPADECELAVELGMDADSLQKMLQEVVSVRVISFEELGFGYGEEHFVPDENLPAAADDPLDEVLETETINLVARALDRLPEKERLVVTLYFYEELNLKEIGEIIGVSESRASQVRSRALIRLRTYLRKSFR